MALGARVGEIVRMVIGQALRLAGLGIACGTIATLATGRLLESQLFGVSESDPLTMVGVGVLLMAVAALAAWVPARRASRVDPVETIRAA
jgi:ABC-type antimicrobial peptide transport system permease subunit